MNYHRIYKNDFVNGEGVRTTLFVSGCDHACKGCYNKSTWRPDSGTPFTDDTIAEIIESLAPDHISGLSLTGGDPLYHGNVGTILRLIGHVRMRYGNTKNIWMWTGYTKQEVEDDDSRQGLRRRIILDNIDVLIDGKFEQDKFEHGLPFRGSTNQLIHRFTEF
ncbi:MAG: anaerobic ribonucleoside-triphosphate reductase activating protein [Bacteroidales bacterium]